MLTADSTPDLVFVGVATHDTIALVDRYPDADERVVATQLVQAGGGPGATAAVAAARLGHSVAFVGTVGADAEGRWILDGLTSEGVDVSGVTIDPRLPSAASLVVVEATRATRAIVNRPPPPIRLSGRAEALMRRAAWIHVDQAGWLPTHRWWSARTVRPKLSVDGGNPIEGFDPTGLDLYVPTISALRRRLGDLERADLLARAVADGSHLVVATDGGDGSFALGPDHDLVHVPAVTGPVRSTLGAGDVFHGALLAACHRGLGLRDCLRYANLVAYRSCQGLDGRSAIPGHDEIVDELSRDAPGDERSTT